MIRRCWWRWYDSEPHNCPENPEGDRPRRTVRTVREWGAHPLWDALRVAGFARQQDGLPQLGESREVLQEEGSQLELAHTLVRLVGSTTGWETG